MRFHHVGVPTTERQDAENYLEGNDLYVTGPETSDHRIEWLRFGPNCPMPEELKTSPHIAFEVDDLKEALKGKDLLIEPFEPMPGLRVAFVKDGDFPVEYMQVLR